MLKQAILTAGTVIIGLMVLIAAAQPEVTDEKSAYEIQTNISGTVVDAESGEGIPEAEVTVVETEESTTTDEYGTFTFSDLESGSYTIQASSDGYQDGESTVDLSEEGATVEIELEPEM